MMWRQLRSLGRTGEAHLARSLCARSLPAVRAPSSARGFANLVGEREPDYVTGDLTGYKVFHRKDPFHLSTGAELPELRVAYETWGELNAHRDNAILLQCGMSASSHACSHTRNQVRGWWEDFIGPGRPLDTNLFHVICTNNLGGCFGSSGPSSFHPADGRRYGSRFPRFDVYDQVAAQFALLDYLGIEKLHACVGASLGGMQSICAAGRFPDRVGKFVTISACAKSFPGSMAFRHAQRQAVMSDPNFKGGDYYEGELPASGLRLARQLGTITYRSGQEWHQRFGQRRHKEAPAPKDLNVEFEIERYLMHQGEKWVNNYDPNSMLWISKAMDSFTMEKADEDGRPSLIEGLADAMQPALVIGVQHDVLFPVWQQKEVADTLRAAGNRRVVYYELDSIYGHDAFLLDAVSIGPAVKGHLEQEPNGAAHLWQDMAATAANCLQAVVSRSSTADSLRDLYRALASGSEAVDRERLRKVVRLIWDGKLTQAQVDTVFEKHLPNQAVTLDQFLGIRESLVEAEHEGAYETYLP
uniref:AB hydrolase-1 domain-containing protein n=1 Tax=Alexandrium monilatum TaxID=311494 RepID=A0A7S4Q845_9DINO